MWSRDLVRSLYPRAAEAHVASFARQAEALLARFEIGHAPNRLHFFLAQIGHESAGLTVTVENLNYRAERILQIWPGRFTSLEAARACAGNPERLANTVYSDRMGNGPFESGDGWRYRGRGYLQLTGRDGYRNVGRIAGLDLVERPDLAAAPDHALLVACAFWEWKGLNRLCDGGDYVAVTRRINGGTVGLADRRAWLDKVRRTFAEPDAEPQPTAEEAVAVQRALQDKGYVEVGAADGIVGRRTIAAITRFRQEHGLPPGLIDEALRVALGIVAA
ncbi:hypothetical protein GCM10010964_42710 [Caldovatus sediminis]|uniref:Chitinase n=1 Tax=Caldovatus sediminis TaxID=2041189 RepID=A0A8J2ZEX0_9PROT|nr:glycoside hydrolase family 19 protein [Caldovatus sediminis]GGG50870.1 hypothetical protein GCM10010964_42710 [Caldovatus sediminis]